MTNCGTFLEMGIPDHLTCFLRNMSASQEETLQTKQRMTGSNLCKEYDKAVYCHPAYLTSMQSTSCKIPGWMNHKLKSRLPGEILTTSDMQMIPLMAESEEELKSFLMKVKEENEKAGLKLNMLKIKIMASSPIILWQINDEIMERVTEFIFLGSKITTNGDCSHEIKRRLLLGRKAVTNLGSLILHSGCDSYILTLLCQ